MINHLKSDEETTNWLFLFIMVGIEFILILIVFILERYFKVKYIKKEQVERKSHLL